MFLHLGSDWSVAMRDIISIHDYAIFAMDGNQAYLKQLEQQGKVVNPLEKEPKSVVVTGDKVYFSAISALTLKRRAQLPFDIDEKY